MYSINSYLGLLDLITIDARKNFISKEFKYYITTLEVIIKLVLIKLHNFIKIVEYYYSPL